MDLRTKYLGLDLKHPIVASPSPISQKLDGVKKLEDAGASAIVLASLFEEQIRYENDSFDYFRHVSSNTFPESLSFFSPTEEFEAGPEQYLELINRAVEATDVPIIASLNASTPEGWAEFAFRMEKAGAAAIELNANFVPDLNHTSEQVEKRYVDIVKMVNRSVGIPVAVKLPPYFSSMGDVARKLSDSGANGLVLFNRFYQPDFNLDEQAVVPSIELSRPHEMRLPLLWIANLYGKLPCSLGATTGVHSGTDAVKYILAGADVAMTTSALLKNGVGFLSTIISEFAEWCERHEYESVSQMRGAMSKRNVEDPSAFDRSNYIKTLQSYVPRNAVV